MIRRRILITGLFFIAVSILFPAPGQAGYEYIDITNPFLRKIPIAIPRFKDISVKAPTRQMSDSAVNLLSRSLEFTGYFKLIDRRAYLYDPQTDGVTAAQINFQNWTVIGAELLITGLYENKDGHLSMELRLFDTVKQRRILGKRYSSSIKDQRRMILRFCSEVIRYLTGRAGVFSSKIAFISNGTGNKEIYVCDFDGTNPRQLTHNNAITLSPAWSTDEKWLAFTSYKRGKPDLFIKNLADSRETVVARKGINITPAWVPGKFELAATLSFLGDPEIYLLTGTGKVIKRLTSMQGNDVSPSWSPDGKKLAFVSNRAGSPQIYIKTIASGEVRRLTFEGRYNTQPAWSPRGDRIAYTSMVNGRQNIFVIGLDDQQPVQLTHDAGDNEASSWSPDGSLLVFSTNREGPSRIYVMTGYGTDQRRLLALKGEQTNPQWSSNVSNN